MAGGVRAKKSDMGTRRGYGSLRWGVGFHPGGAMHWDISPTGTGIFVH